MLFERVGRYFFKISIIGFCFLGFCKVALATSCKEVFTRSDLRSLDARIFGLNAAYDSAVTRMSFSNDISLPEKARVSDIITEINGLLPGIYRPDSIEVRKGGPRDNYAIPDWGLLVIGRELYETQLGVDSNHRLTLLRDDSSYKKVVTHEVAHVVLEKAWINVRMESGMSIPNREVRNELMFAVHELFADFIPDLLRGPNSVANLFGEPHRQFANRMSEWPDGYFYPRYLMERNRYSITLPTRIFINEYVLKPVRQGTKSKDEALKEVLTALVKSLNRFYDYGSREVQLSDGVLNEINAFLISKLDAQLTNSKSGEPFAPQSSYSH